MNPFCTYLIIFCLSFSSFSSLFSQVESKWFEVGKSPINGGYYNKSSSPPFIVPEEDIQKALTSISFRSDTTKIGSICGVVIPLSSDHQNFYLTDISDNKLIKKITILAPGAKGITICFDSIFLDQETEIVLYNRDKNFVFGPFSSRNIYKHEFWTDVVPGESVTLEIKSKAGSNDKIHISNIIYSIAEERINPFNNATPKLESCQINVKCPDGNDFLTERDAVCHIYVTVGSHLHQTTGCLIANNSSTFVPYILTAFHGLDDDASGSLSPSEIASLSNVQCRFFYESSSCSSEGSSNSVTFNGADFVAAYRYEDVLLFRLYPTNIIDCRFSYLGWEKNADNPSKVTMLHHPAGSPMKISIASNGAITFPGQVYLSGGIYFPENYAQEELWSNGISESGSSGAPLLNQNKLFVGQHSGGWTWCNVPGHAYGGRLYYSWDHGSTADQRLKDWLDPNNTGASILLTKRNFSFTGPDFICSSNNYQYILNNAPTGVGITWTLTGPNTSSGSGNIANIYINSSYTGLHTLTFLVYHPSKGNISFSKSFWVGRPQTPNPIEIEMDAPPHRFTCTTSDAGGSTSFKWYKNGSLQSGFSDDVAIFNMTSPYCGHSYAIGVEAVNICGISSRRNKTAIEDPCGGQLIISPNPANDEIEVTLNDITLESTNFESLDIQITNFQGLIVMSKVEENNKFTINTSSLKDGIYIISVEKNSNQYSKQFIVKH